MKQDNLTRFKQILKIIKQSDIIHGLTPEKLYDMIVKLGPTFIKLGQILSTRVDLFPEEYIKKLSQLRSKVAPIDFLKIEAILNKSYGNYHNIFKYVDSKALGSASIAQVHKAILKDDTQVVIKIKKPDIEKIMIQDINLFQKAIKTLKLNKFIKVINLNEVLEQVKSSVLEETNFLKEANNLIKFSKNQQDIKYISSPKIYPDLSNNDCIVMEYIKGIKIDNIKKLSKQGYDLKQIASLVGVNYIKQALEDGFFHADPHPDNILISYDKIMFIDLGMMGKITPKNQKLLSKCVRAIVNNDYHSVTDILIEMSKTLEEFDYNELKNDIQNILEEFQNTALEDIQASKFFNQMFIILQNNHLMLDKDVTLLVRGIIIIEGVLKNLDPTISLYTILEESILYSNTTKKQIFDNLKDVNKKISQCGNSLISLPKELNNLIKDLNNGKIKFNFELANSNKQVDKIESLVHELILGFIDGCLIISASIVDEAYIKLVFILFIIIVSSILVTKIIIDHNHHGY